MASTMPIVQTWPNKMHVPSYPPWDGIHKEGLDLEANQIDGSHDRNDPDRGPQLLMPTRQSMT
jgi:hypothetical protein